MTIFNSLLKCATAPTYADRSPLPPGSGMSGRPCRTGQKVARQISPFCTTRPAITEEPPTAH